MRVALLDPPSFTAPYDHALASALARRGHDVTLLASPFTHGEIPAPDGYRREEVFLSFSSRLSRLAPRSRVRLVLKGLDYGRAPSGSSGGSKDCGRTSCTCNGSACRATTSSGFAA